MLNILSIDDGEEWFEPRPPVYWVKTLWEHNFRYHMLPGLMREALKDYNNTNFFHDAAKIGDKVSFRPIGKLIGA